MGHTTNPYHCQAAGEGVDMNDSGEAHGIGLGSLCREDKVSMIIGAIWTVVTVATAAFFIGWWILGG